MQLAHLLPDNHPLRNLTTEAQLASLREKMEAAHAEYLKVKHLKNANTKYFKRYQMLKKRFDNMMAEAQA